MINAVGIPQSVLLLGATSEIGLAIVDEYVGAGASRVVLAGRPGPRRDDAVAALAGRGVHTTVLDFYAERTDEHAHVVATAFATGDIDVVVVAFGVLGDEEEAWKQHAAAMEHVAVNLTAAVSVGVLVTDAMRRQGHGLLVALSSVAGERVRRSNFVYGSTKAGMDAFYRGLAMATADEGMRVLVVRPGFVSSRMTHGRRPAPLAARPSDVARAVVEAGVARREVVWVPARMRLVMWVLRLLPGPVFRRLPL
jgi:decaprenylphospho-beta-D-erythro-pentofuranosid-2-ulose 2-reductase